MIKVSKGIYKPFSLTKEGITVEGSDPVKRPVILADEGETVNIEFKGEVPCILKNLKLAHTSSECKINFQSFLNRFLRIERPQQPKDDTLKVQNLAEKTSFFTNNISLLKNRKGKLIVADCLVTYEFLSKAIHREIPAIMLFPGTETYITKTIIKGISFHIEQTVGYNILTSYTLAPFKARPFHAIYQLIFMYVCMYLQS